MNFTDKRLTDIEEQMKCMSAGLGEMIDENEKSLNDHLAHYTKTIAEMQNKIANSYQYYLDKSDQTMRKFDEVLQYISDVDKRVAELKQRMLAYENKDFKWVMKEKKDAPAVDESTLMHQFKRAKECGEYDLYIDGIGDFHINYKPEALAVDCQHRHDKGTGIKVCDKPEAKPECKHDWHHGSMNESVCYKCGKMVTDRYGDMGIRQGEIICEKCGIRYTMDIGHTCVEAKPECKHDDNTICHLCATTLVAKTKPSATEGQGKKSKDPETGEYTLENQLHDYFIDNMRDEDMDFGDDNSWVAINFAEMAIEFFHSHKDKVNTCGCCGGKLVYIRGKHPTHDNREVCPTCCQERLEQINEVSDKNYGKASTALGAERGEK